MMNQKLLHKHLVRFEHVRDEFYEVEFKVTGATVANFMSEFLRFSCEIEYQEAIHLLDIYIKGETHPTGDNSINGGEVYTAWFDNTTVDILDNYDPDPSHILRSLPIEEFKEILEMSWEFKNSIKKMHKK